MRIRNNNKKQKRGNAIIEFAIASSVLIPLFTGVFQFGYSYYMYNTLESRVHAAARYAATRTYDSPNATPSSGFASAVKNMAVTGDPSVSPTGPQPGVTPGILSNILSSDNIQVTMTFADGAPSEVTVNLTGFQMDAFFGTVNLNTKPVVTFPYIGRWDPI